MALTGVHDVAWDGAVCALQFTYFFRSTHGVLFNDRISDFVCSAVRMYLRRAFNTPPEPRLAMPRPDVNSSWCVSYDAVGMEAAMSRSAHSVRGTDGLVASSPEVGAARAGAGAGTGAGAAGTTSYTVEPLGGVGDMLHIMPASSALAFNCDDIGALVHHALVDVANFREVAESLCAPFPLSLLGTDESQAPSSPKPSVMLRLRARVERASEDEVKDAVAFCLAHHFLWSVFTCVWGSCTCTFGHWLWVFFLVVSWVVFVVPAVGWVAG